MAAHEIAHLAVAWVLGLQVERLVLTPFGGMAQMEAPLEVDPQAETSVALAGPFQSFLLAGLTLFLARGQIWDQKLLRFCFDVNTSLAFFNLIPALPLDGGRALRGLLSQRWGYSTVTAWMIQAGRVCGVAMTAVAVFVFARHGQVYITPVVAGLFLLLGAGRELEAVTYRSYRQFLKKRAVLGRRRILAARQLVVVEGTKLSEILVGLASSRYHLVLVVDKALRPLGTLHEGELMDAFAELGPSATVEQILDR